MLKYRIDGQYLDKFKNNKEFAITKQVSKIGEINLRHGDVSTSFKVPLTAFNAKILRYTPELNNLNESNNFDKYNGQIIEDDAVISDGYYQVTGFNPTKKEVELRFYGGNTGWFDLLKDRYINERIRREDSEFPYDLDDFSHAYTESNIVSSWDLSNDLPYYYFLNDNGKNSLKTTPSATTKEDWRLSIFEHEIITKIFDSVGITLAGNLLKSPSFYSTAIPTVLDIETVDAIESNKNFSVENNVQEITNAYTRINFNTGNYDSRWSGFEFTASEDSTVLEITDLRVSFEGTTSDPTGTICTLRYSDNGAVSTLNLAQLTNPSVDFGDFVYELDSPLTFNLDEGEYLSIWFKHDLTNARTISNATSGDERTFIKYKTTTNATTIEDVTKYLPKIKQTDFIKDLMFREGVISQYDVKTKTLTLDRFETIEDNIGKGEDWSKKIDLSKEIKVDYTKILQNYAKRSNIQYEEDENDINTSLQKSVYGYVLGRGVINIENDFLSDEEDIYNSPYATTATVKTFATVKEDQQLIPTVGDMWLPFIPTNKLSDTDENGDAVYESNEIKPRIVVATGLLETDNFMINGSSIGLGGSNYNSIGYAYFLKPFMGDLENVNDPTDINRITQSLAYQFPNDTIQTYSGDPLLNKNYGFYKKILNNPIYVSIYLNLNNLDVQKVDFLKPIYLNYKYDSGYYYIDSIDQYKGDGESTKVNLVKI